MLRECGAGRCRRADGAPGRPPILAFTATATPEVRQDIVGLLGLSDPEVFVAGRLALDANRMWFVDVGATASILFLREEASLVGVPGVVGGASVGARF